MVDFGNDVLVSLLRFGTMVLWGGFWVLTALLVVNVLWLVVLLIGRPVSEVWARYQPCGVGVVSGGGGLVSWREWREERQSIGSVIWCSRDAYARAWGHSWRSYWWDGGAR